MGFKGARSRQLMRAELIGSEGMMQQDARAKAAGEAGAAREAAKRVREYKQGRVDKSDGTNDYINRRNQEDL